MPSRVPTAPHSASNQSRPSKLLRHRYQKGHRADLVIAGSVPSAKRARRECRGGREPGLAAQALGPTQSCTSGSIDRAQSQVSLQRA